MGRRPEGPPRFLKTRYLIAAAVSVVAVIAASAGFALANKEVSVVVDGRSSIVGTRARDVAGLLREGRVKVGEGDVVSPAPGASLRSGMTVTVRHAMPVRLDLGGQVLELNVVGSTVADALIAAGLDPTAGMQVTPPVEERLRPNMTIAATDVFLRVVPEERAVPFRTRVVYDDGLNAGERRVVTSGAPGRALRIYEAVVTGGKEGRRILRTERVVQVAVDQVVALGTKRSSVRLASRGASRPRTAYLRPPKSGRSLRVVATAYAPGHNAGTRTATGARAGFGIIAVDPKVIPLGTRLYVPGYGYAVAADTGGLIRGNHIDLCFDSVAQARAWGRRTITIVILR